MDELSAFKGAHSHLPMLEKQLFRHVDLVFTGGQSLYEAKCDQHPSVYAFPSSIDASHFGKARNIAEDPEDQANIPHPRLGFFGVIDERFDSRTAGSGCRQRPDWHFVMIGPIVKIDPDDAAAARKHSLSRRQRDTGTSGVPGRLGHRAVVVCAERIHTFY